MNDNGSTIVYGSVEDGLFCQSYLGEMERIEEQLATVYHFDNDGVWRELHDAAQAAWHSCSEQIKQRSKELGIPREFAPELSPPFWFGRGENGVRERRAELTRVAHSKIEALEKQAKHEIEKASVECQTKILADGLESTAARAFLAAMPTAEQLIPSITIAEAEQLAKRI